MSGDDYLIMKSNERRLADAGDEYYMRLGWFEQHAQTEAGYSLDFEDQVTVVGKFARLKEFIADLQPTHTFKHGLVTDSTFRRRRQDCDVDYQLQVFGDPTRAAADDDRALLLIGYAPKGGKKKSTSHARKSKGSSAERD